MEGCSHTWKTGEETVLHLVLSLGVLSCRRSVPLCIPGAESGLSSSALPSLGRQQIHDSLERLSFSQTVAYLISVSSDLLFSTAASYSSWQAALNVHTISICKGLSCIELNWQWQKKVSPLITSTDNSAFSSLHELPERFPNTALRFPNNPDSFLFSTCGKQTYSLETSAENMSFSVRFS